ncbi:6748_t:CDS:2, partial [Funneliformis caledonium]
TDFQPFNSANGEGFLRMINKLDPEFKLSCYVMIKKDIIYRYQAVFQVIKEMITHTCDIAAITTDLWTSYAKSENMELYDILICVALINYPHNGNNIHQTILIKLQLLELDSKVNVAITNNGSNMIKAIHEWDSVNHIPCNNNNITIDEDSEDNESVLDDKESDDNNDKE